MWPALKPSCIGYISPENMCYLVWYFGRKVDTYKHAYTHALTIFNLTSPERGAARWDPAHAALGVIMYVHVMV